MVQDIIEQVYTETGDFKIKEYLKNRWMNAAYIMAVTKMDIDPSGDTHRTGSSFSSLLYDLEYFSTYHPALWAPLLRWMRGIEILYLSILDYRRKFLRRYLLWLVSSAGVRTVMKNWTLKVSASFVRHTKMYLKIRLTYLSRNDKCSLSLGYEVNWYSNMDK